MPRRHRLLVLLPLVLLTAATTTGCSPIANALQKTHEEAFADTTAAEQGWQGVPAPGWLPADATEIRNLATTDETNSMILVTSASPLPAGCVEADRSGIPFESPDWAPELSSFPDRVERCGDYEVMPVDGGWLGWFTATAEAETPASAAP